MPRGSLAPDCPHPMGRATAERVLDAVGRHRLLVPEQGIEIARYSGPGGDLQRTNVGKAVFAERSKGCFEHAFTS